MIRAFLWLNRIKPTSTLIGLFKEFRMTAYTNADFEKKKDKTLEIIKNRYQELEENLREVELSKDALDNFYFRSEVPLLVELKNKSKYIIYPKTYFDEKKSKVPWAWRWEPVFLKFAPSKFKLVGVKKVSNYITGETIYVDGGSLANY